MLSKNLRSFYQSQADFIKANGWGYAQLEPNHLSAQFSKEIYAQMPAAPDIEILEQGQFVKYDMENMECNFTGDGEWMLVYNEIKLYRPEQEDCEFALRKDDYQARVYSPYDWEIGENWERQTRYYNGQGVDAADGSITFDNDAHTVTVNGQTFGIDDVTAGADPYEFHYEEDPFHILSPYKERLMPAGTTMVPRVYKTHIGDHFTTNMLAAEEVALGDLFSPNDMGILAPAGDDAEMVWKAVKIYTMPDGQPGVKVLRIK